MQNGPSVFGDTTSTMCGPIVESADLRLLRALGSRNVEASLPARFPNRKLGGINKQDSHKERGTIGAQVKCSITGYLIAGLIN
ncbi:hypothetical protein PsB1_0612 [Candidatus Phycosocius spiralis]|uniref:Uncharacterized protein n=1 Tax=Candidatus Phycosocius spiralis TaxID=2815099 RepID=A0ABQ4PTY9_9PROT|nr:hypothetical protein PsB1_0612 [Candidatus Phycosocius spiralis]